MGLKRFVILFLAKVIKEVQITEVIELTGRLLNYWQKI
jgi:hypothetical protein